MAQDKIGFDLKEMEEMILKQWNEIDLRSKIIEKNRNGKPYYFLQGPPYTSGRLHIAHAWNHSIKDMILRYQKMNGRDVFDRAGYDMHGLPTERKVQAKLNLKTKEDIEKFGLVNFEKECKKFSEDNAKLMNEDLKRVGIDMDFENAYLPVNNEYMEGIWHLIKKANEKNRLYKGLRTISWCPSCQTALSKHEQEYQEREDDAIFVKFKSRNNKNEFLIVWTTTPWTIPYNLAVMVHPEIEYSLVEVMEGKFKGENWIVAFSRIEYFEKVADTKLKYIKTILGKDLEGYEYEHFFEKEIKEFKKIKENSPKAHTVLLSNEYVTDSDGSGLVHCAPGCGPEDYEVGYSNGIPPFNELDESGVFKDTMGVFSKMISKTDDKEFIKLIDEYGGLVAKHKYVHDYAHCQRCKAPITFRTTPQWFFKIEDLKEKMLSLNSEVYWYPQTAKNAFNSWLDNLRDNSITKQRFWGTPVPIWECECGYYHVIDNSKEIESMGGKVPKDLHRPFIDDVELICPKCSKKMKRVPDVLDVWIDAGSASWNALDYPRRTDLFDKYFPADFIVEGKDQIRGWFNLLMIASAVLFEDKPFLNVSMHGFLSGVDGVKMSKSLGNIISPYELIDKYGADTLRSYMSGINAGEDISFSWDEALLRNKNLQILINLANYLITTSNDLEIKPKLIEKVNSSESKYIMSYMNRILKEVTELFEKYQYDKISQKCTDLFLELSRTYVQLIRDKLVESDLKEKQEIIDVIYTVLLNNLKIFATVAPFTTDYLYNKFKIELNLELKESIHLEDWPKYNEKMISERLEADFGVMQDIVTAVLAARNKAQLGVRWPLRSIFIDLNSDTNLEVLVNETIDNYKDLILSQTNIKEIKFTKASFKLKLQLEYGKLGREFGQDTAFIIPILTSKISELESYFIDNSIYKLKFKTDDKEEKEVDITLDFFKVERTMESGYSFSEFKKGYIFITTILNDDLASEGFAREISRRVQQERKEMGLIKSDNVVVEIQTSLKEKKKFFDKLNTMKDKIGAISIEEKENLDSKPIKIKDEEFKISVIKK
ncbi:MAG: isoleucine--tRNA ligase [Candidatus Nanoarchaeia archaeon]|nr:isoleucine--tRNA ligase [Candidatus Nanoarchaeia archaeon]